MPVISTVFSSFNSLVKLTHSLIFEAVRAGDIVIDATVGNGCDTQFLLKLIGSSGRVIGFDIQQAAITATLKRLKDQDNHDCLELINASHANLVELIPSVYRGKISAVMFNLGYLPGGDKQIITQAESTIDALFAATQVLSDCGIITVLVYPGHLGGKLEADTVSRWCSRLDSKQFHVALYRNRPENSFAPILFVLNRIAIDENQDML